MNRIQLIGNLGKDPELQQLSNNTRLVKLRIATTERSFIASNGVTVPERTTWHTVNCWQGNADAVMACLQRGSKVFCEGILHCNEFEKNGDKIQVWEIDCSSIEFLANLKPKPNH